MQCKEKPGKLLRFVVDEAPALYVGEQRIKVVLEVVIAEHVLQFFVVIKVLPWLLF